MFWQDQERAIWIKYGTLFTRANTQLLGNCRDVSAQTARAPTSLWRILAEIYPRVDGDRDGFRQSGRQGEALEQKVGVGYPMVWTLVIDNDK